MALSLLQRAVWEQGARRVGPVAGLTPDDVLKEIKTRDGRSLFEWIGGLPPPQQQALFRMRRLGASLVDQEILGIADPAAREAASYDWKIAGRPEQFSPPGNWRTWVIQAGRGFGKTMAGAQFVRQEIERGRARRVYIVGATASDVRDVMIEGPSGILAVSTPGWRPHYEPSKSRITWPNGAIGILRTAEKPDRMRGPQGDLAWLDELAAWKYPEEAYDQLKFGLRLGKPRTVITTTPRPIKLLREILRDKHTVVTRGSTFDNADNLAEAFLDEIMRRFGETRLGRQEIFAELLEDNPGALWRLVEIDALRRPAPQLRRVVVAIDPSISAKADSDETGIVTAGIGMCSCKGDPELHGFVLDDASGIYTPVGWATRALEQYTTYKADAIVAEVNQGGDLVEANLQANGMGNLRYKAIHATRGKVLRAEPVAALDEQGKVHHVATFAKLEDQMTQWNPLEDVKSPDRVDARVYALTELMIGPTGPEFVRRDKPVFTRRR